MGEGPSPELVELRDAEPRELDALVSLSLACGRSHRGWSAADWTPPVLVAERELWWRRLHDPHAWTGVAVAGATRVGCVSFSPVRRAEALQLGYLRGPLVDPEWWGEGIGSALHDEVMGVLAALRYRRVEIAVEAGNSRARRFLERRGWERGEGRAERSAMALLTYTRRVPGLAPTRFKRHDRTTVG